MSINPCDIIRKKRFGEELNEMEIRAFVDGIVDGSFADYQASALLMAICINGMTDRETLSLTLEMAKSGDMLDLGNIPGIKADKQYLPFTIVEDGFVSEENLRKSGKDEAWVKSVLREKRATLRDTLLLTVDSAGHVMFMRKEQP